MKNFIRSFTILVSLSFTQFACGELMNGSFESNYGLLTPDTSSPAFGQSLGSITSWTGTVSSAGNPNFANGDGFGADVAGGQYVAGDEINQLAPTDGNTFLVWNTSTFGALSVLEQTGVNFAAGTYNIAYDVGAYGNSEVRSINMIVLDESSGTLFSETTNLDSTSNGWAPTVNGSFTVNVDQQLSFQFSMTDFNFTGTDTGFVAIDNIRVNAVPEPSTLGLLAVGGIALGFYRRKRRHQPGPAS